MIFGRILLLLGSVLALFALWRLFAPLYYARLEPDGGTALVFLLIGGAMAWGGYRLERRNNDGTGSHE